MASPLTATYNSKVREKTTRQPVMLVKVELASPSTRTVYLSSADVTTPDGVRWNPVIVETSRVFAPGAMLADIPQPCAFDFAIAAQAPLGFQAVGKVAADLLTDFRWLGAAVTVYHWDRAFTSFSDAGTWLKNGRINDVELTLERVRVFCVQRSDWNRIMTRSVRRSQYPRAPQSSLGAALPVIYGHVRGPHMREASSAVWANEYDANRNRLERIHGGQVGIPGVVVDHGKGGGTKRKVVFAGHEVKALNDAANGTRFYILDSGNRVLHPVDPAGGDVVNDANGAGFTMPDDFDKCAYALFPSDIEVVGATEGSEQRYAIDQFDELSYALLDWDANKREIRWRLPSIAQPGAMLASGAVSIIIGYRTSSTLTNFEAGIVHRASATAENFALIVQSGSPSAEEFALADSTFDASGALPREPWAFDECYLRVRWSAGTNTGQWVRVYFIGLSIKFKPSQFLQSYVTTQPGFTRRVYGGSPGRLPDITIPEIRVALPLAPTPPFAATLGGHKDDGSGTDTGTVNALIERFPDVGRHALKTYGAQSAGQIETGVGVHGSFVDARTTLKHIYQRDPLAACAITEPVTVAEFMGWLARGSLSWILLSRFDDKFKWVTWKTGTGVAYDRKLGVADLVDLPTVERVTAKDLVSSVRLPFYWDPITQAYRSEATVRYDSSSSGWKYGSVRHQHLTVAASENDRINLKTGGTTYTLTLSPGDYTDDTLVSALQAINGVVNPVSVAFGGRIVSNKNNEFQFNDGTERAAILTPGLYSMEGLAAQVQTQMNAISTNWTVTYSRTTRKFTISRSSGTAHLKFATSAAGADQQEQCAAALGFTNEQHTAGSPYVSDFKVDEEKVAFSASFDFQLLWQSGPDGLDAATPRMAADLLGWDARHDTDSQKWQTALSPKWYSERTLADSVARFGHKREMVIDGRAIYDTDTALDVIRRVIQWLGDQRLILRVPTYGCDDMERGRVIEFKSDLEAHMPYPKDGSDGSWVGKKFMVVEVTQATGPTFEQELMAVEV